MASVRLPRLVYSKIMLMALSRNPLSSAVAASCKRRAVTEECSSASVRSGPEGGPIKGSSNASTLETANLVRRKPSIAGLVGLGRSGTERRGCQDKASKDGTSMGTGGGHGQALLRCK